MRVRVNDTTLFFDVEGPKLVPDGPSMREKPTVLLLHGGPGFDHSNFKPDYSQLSDVAQLVYLDHRGNGRSDRGDASTWNLDTWADDVKGFCDALEIEAPIMLGWSFGGFVAMAYAARHPGHAKKVILQSTAAHLDVERIVAAFSALGGPVAAEAARTFWTAHDNESMMGYLEHCIPLYHSESLTDVTARCVLNLPAGRLRRRDGNGPAPRIGRGPGTGADPRRSQGSDYAGGRRPGDRQVSPGTRCDAEDLRRFQPLHSGRRA